MKKKLLTGALILSSVLALTACGKKPDAKELMNTANENLKAYQSIAFDVDCDLGATVSVSAEGSESSTTTKGSVGLDGSFETNLDTENPGVYADMTVKYDVPTGADSENVKMYMTLKDKVATIYTYDNEEKVWYASEEEMDEDAMTELEGFDYEKYEEDLNAIVKDKGTYTLREKTEKVNDVECWVVDYTLTAADIFDIVKGSADFAKENSGDISEDVKEEVNTALGEAEKYFENIKNIESDVVMTVYISKKEELPVKYVYDGSEFIMSVVDVAFDTVEQVILDYAKEQGVSEEEAKEAAKQVLSAFSVDAVTAKFEVIITGYSEEGVKVPADVVDNAIKY